MQLSTQYQGIILSVYSEVNGNTYASVQHCKAVPLHSSQLIIQDNGPCIESGVHKVLLQITQQPLVA